MINTSLVCTVWSKPASMVLSRKRCSQTDLSQVYETWRCHKVLECRLPLTFTFIFRNTVHRIDPHFLHKFQLLVPCLKTLCSTCRSRFCIMYENKQTNKQKTTTTTTKTVQTKTHNIRQCVPLCFIREDPGLQLYIIANEQEKCLYIYTIASENTMTVVRVCLNFHGEIGIT